MSESAHQTVRAVILLLIITTALYFSSSRFDGTELAALAAIGTALGCDRVVLLKHIRKLLGGDVICPHCGKDRMTTGKFQSKGES